MEPREKAIFVLFLGVAVVNLSFTVSLQQDLQAAQERITQANDSREDLRDFISGEQLTNETIAGPSGTAASETSKETFSVAAYDATIARGVVIRGSLIPLPQEKLYVEASDIAYTSTMQRSFSYALTETQSEGYNTSKGFALQLKTPAKWERIGGGSAAVSVALAYAATSPNYSKNESVIATGTLNNEGDVGRVGKIKEKARAARASGYELLLVPPGQTRIVSGIKIKEVSSLSEAAKYGLVDG